jgi:anti-sigma factor RsiW
MTEADANLERLIVRGLDGALSDEELLDRDRELIRNPQARALHDEYARIDSLAIDALRAAVMEERLCFDPAALCQAEPRKANWSPTRSWWLVPGAIAAACLAVFVARISDPPVTPDRAPSGFVAHNDPYTGNRGTQHMVPAAGLRPNGADDAGLLQTIGATPRIQRDTGREVIGVWGEDGNLYWLEIDRTRALRRVPDRAGIGAIRETI